MCYCVDQTQKGRDQAVEVLEHYNVTVSQRDIFSRCQVQRTIDSKLNKATRLMLQVRFYNHYSFCENFIVSTHIIFANV